MLNEEGNHLSNTFPAYILSVYAKHIMLSQVFSHHHHNHQHEWGKTNSFHNKKNSNDKISAMRFIRLLKKEAFRL